ncbi:MAG: hypothetical protein H6765_04065 [Candidatus Peribacteria bacterium]|nr:MAG: hypothetical protein H6765_04065 [Candidatus Peribacteria bacterium]
MRYYANNALNMHLYVLLPNLKDITKNMDQIGNINLLQTFRFDRKDTREALEQVDNSGTQKLFDDQTTPNDKRFLPRSVLDSLSSDLNNPFEMIAQYFENIPLINIEEKVLSIEIPFIYQEDSARYDYYLESWLDRNEKILAGWKAIDPPVDSNAIAEMEQAVANVKVNLQVLREYKDLPSKIATMIHTYDQYLVEVYNFMDDFVTEITGWLQLNAQRFSQWVDFIILIIGIVETWQLLIDFSVDRNTKCAKCRQDNYDYYSCRLSLLCVDLPILPIPNFHLPDIYLDLSDFNIGLDIIVPRFNFTPRMLPLIRLPDLPPPSNVQIDLDIPEIPRLPMPPPLPQMPTLDLKIDIALPNLPPVPKLPKLSPAIKTIIKVADFIGSIWCIFKSGL